MRGYSALYMCQLAFVLLQFNSHFSKADEANKGTKEKTVDEYLSSQLTSYELLPLGRLISRRSAGDDSSGRATHYLHFRAFKREFNLVLKPDPAHINRNWLNIAVRENDQAPVASEMELSPAELLSEFYVGYIDDKPHSHVSGYRDHDRFHLTISEGKGSDVLTIEPLSLLTGNLSETRMLAYYDSSMSASPYSCGVSSDTLSPPTGTRTHDSRSRRSTSEDYVISKMFPYFNVTRRTHIHLKRVCSLMMVADHTLVNHFGSAVTTLRFLMKVVDDVNALYERVQFSTKDGSANFTGIGFELDFVTALTGPTVVPALEPFHFNAALPGQKGAEKAMSAKKLLEAFGDYQQHGIKMKKYCLSHLATYRRITDRVLGLAHQGSKSAAFQGGLCSPSSMSQLGRGRHVARNIGLTTFSMQDGKALLTRQATLVTAHELAHNLGAPHDPPTKECSPGPAHGGNYLMHERSVSGKGVNHARLSPCSRRVIADVLKNRQEECLKRPFAVCGNNRPELLEQCDAGPLGDDCCNSSCLLNTGAVCSDANSACCRFCRLRSAGTVCRSASPLWPCRSDAVCDGVHATCPPGERAPPLKDGAICPLGACKAGECWTACQLAGLNDCVCPSKEVVGNGSRPVSEAVRGCFVCCSPKAGGKCTALRSKSGGHVRWPECPEEAAEAAVAVAGGGGLSGQLWRLAWRVGGDTVAMILRWNTVFLIVLLSLLIYVPICCVCEYRPQPRVAGNETATPTVANRSNFIA